MTAGERLEQLAGITGSAASLLMAIGAGATAAARLVAYSGLASASAAIHLLTDVTSEPPAEPDTHDGWLVAPVGKRSKRKKFDRLLEELMALYEELSAEAVEPVPMARPVVADYIKPASPTLAPMAANPPPTIDWDALRRDMARLYMLIEQNRLAIEDEEEAEMLLLM